jgi:hypothetical protein
MVKQQINGILYTFNKCGLIEFKKIRKEKCNYVFMTTTKYGVQLINSNPYLFSLWDEHFDTKGKAKWSQCEDCELWFRHTCKISAHERECYEAAQRGGDDDSVSSGR